LKFAEIECRLQCFQEEPFKKFRQNADVQKEVPAAGDPPLAIGRQTTARNDAVQVRVKLEVRPPRVEDSEESDLRSEMLWIRRDGSQCLGGDSEEDAKDQLFILVGDGRDLLGTVKTT